MMMMSQFIHNQHRLRRPSHVEGPECECQLGDRTPFPSLSPAATIRDKRRGSMLQSTPRMLTDNIRTTSMHPGVHIITENRISPYYLCKAILQYGLGSDVV